jgi:hypothetical protein
MARLDWPSIVPDAGVIETPLVDESVFFTVTIRPEDAAGSVTTIAPPAAFASTISFAAAV